MNDCLSPLVKGRPETVLAQLGERMGELDLLLYSVKLNRLGGRDSAAVLTRAHEQSVAITALIEILQGGGIG